MSGGWGGGAQTYLDGLEYPNIAMVASEGSVERDRSGLIAFLNKRAEWWWKFREALDPVHGDNVALPPDPRLKAQLCAPHWILKTRQGAAAYQIESKDEVRKRLGSSTDDADAVITAWATRHEGLTRGDDERTRRGRGGSRGSAWMGA
jgi:hypothetical protein